MCALSLFRALILAQRGPPGLVSRPAPMDSDQGRQMLEHGVQDSNAADMSQLALPPPSKELACGDILDFQTGVLLRHDPAKRVLWLLRLG